MSRRGWLIGVCALAVGCGSSPGLDGSARDADAVDAAVALDDAGETGPDEVGLDAAPADAATLDAKVTDAAADDAAVEDAEETADGAAVADAAEEADAAVVSDDAGAMEAGTPDAGLDCPRHAEVVFYTQSAWNILASALAADASPCADYYLSIPAVTADKTQPRGSGQPAQIRSQGPAFHAMAEFHWASWSNAPGSWYDRGVEFRRRMDAAGYDVSQGDLWALNELPSSVRSNAAVRQNVIDVVHGLFDGPAGAPAVRGTVFTIGLGHGTVNFSVYKPLLETWIEEASFWSAVNLHVRFWAQEVYADPSYVCVPGTTVGARSGHINEYVEHVARLAEVGPAQAATARSYFSRAYVPLMNAVWSSSGNGYGNTAIPLDQMQHHVSGQVYAARAWSTNHPYPDGRLGFAWARYNATDPELTALALRLAAAIHGAYDLGGGAAARACSPTGAYTWCQCSVAGAQFNPGWSTFSTY